MSEDRREDVLRINLVKLFKHFDEAKIPVTEEVFNEYCNKEGIKDISFQQYQDKKCDWQEDNIVRETLPHIFRILGETPDLHMSDFDLSSRNNQIAKNIRKVQAEIAHLMKRHDVPYDRHGDIMYTIARLVNAILDQATDTNRRDLSLALEHMGRKEFGHDMTMADIAKYNEAHKTNEQ